MKSIVLCISLAVLAGCSISGKLRKANGRLGATNSALDEVSRELTTGAADALSHTNSPRTPHTEVALRFLRYEQQIEGLPVSRLPVSEMLSGDEDASDRVNARTSAIETALAERRRLQSEVDELTGRLVELGQKYEEERRKTVWRRIVASLGLGGSIAAVVAMFIFFPPALAIAGRLMAFAVSKLPAMAGFLGVVGTKAFDRVVKGVEKAREKTRNPVIDESLRDEMKEHPEVKRVVRLRKAVVT
jgi:hypothetical protein